MGSMLTGRLGHGWNEEPRHTIHALFDHINPFLGIHRDTRGHPKTFLIPFLNDRQEIPGRIEFQDRFGARIAGIKITIREGQIRDFIVLAATRETLMAAMNFPRESNFWILRLSESAT